ncbi:MAG: hypothetical protein RL095_2588 [Verrucomicrobiota bacterium]|jgi:hypothetical protein
MEKTTTTSEAAGSGRLYGLYVPVWAERLLGIWMAALAFLLPFKFGSSTSQNAPVSVPLDFFSTLFFSWPPMFLCAAAAAALAMSVMLWSKRHLPNPASFALLGWGLMALAAFVLGRNSEQGQLLCYTWLAALFFGAAALIARRHHSRVADYALAGLVLGTLVTALSGLNQYFFGFAELQEQMRQMSNGAVLDPRIIEKAKEDLVKCNFAYSNSLGGHLLLCGPVAAAWLYEKGRERQWGRVGFAIVGLLVLAALIYLCRSLSDRVFLRWLLIFVVLIAIHGPLVFFYASERKRHWGGYAFYLSALLLLSVFLLTRSRAALASLLLAGLLVLIWRFCRGLKLAVALAALLGLALVVAYVGVKEPSFQVRMDYWRVCLEMWQSSPLTGCGTGSFQASYLAAKDPGLPDAVLSHSLLMGQLAENGLAGLLPWFLITGCLLAIALNAARHSLFGCAFAWGLLGWWLHAQLDFDAHIPASAAAFALLLAVAPQLRHDKAMPGAASNLVNLVLLLGGAVSLLLSLHSCEGYRRTSQFEREMFGEAWIDQVYSRDFVQMEKTFRERLAAASCPFCASDKLDPRLWASRGRCSDCGARAHAGLLTASEVVQESEEAGRLLPLAHQIEGVTLHKLIYNWKIGQIQGQLAAPGAPGRAETEDCLAAAESYLRSRVDAGHKDTLLDLASILALRGAPPGEIAAVRRRAFMLQPWSPEGAQQNAEWVQMMATVVPHDPRMRSLFIVSRASHLLQSLRSELINRRWDEARIFSWTRLRGNPEIDLDRVAAELVRLQTPLKEEKTADAELILKWMARTKSEFGVSL